MALPGMRYSGPTANFKNIMFKSVRFSFSTFFYKFQLLQYHVIKCGDLTVLSMAVLSCKT